MEIKTYKIQTDKIRRGSRLLRIVMLSDLHDRLWGEGQKTLFDAIDSLSPDLVLCAGDMLVGGREAGMEHALLLFEKLCQRPVPVIACNGNHESRMRLQKDIYGGQYAYYAGKLRELGVQLLVNEACMVEHDGARIRICGYEMPLLYYRKFGTLPYSGEDLYQIFGEPEQDIYHILLAHNPVYFKAYARWGADLTLSGHLHGGIIRIPGLGGLITPQAKLFPKYDKGLFEKHGRYLAVSAGLGEHTVPIRICNPRQLICIVLEGTG